MRKIRGKKVSVQVRCRRACRGGGWYYGDPAAVRAPYRDKYVPTFWNFDFGFRFSRGVYVR